MSKNDQRTVRIIPVSLPPVMLHCNTIGRPPSQARKGGRLDEFVSMRAIPVPPHGAGRRRRKKTQLLLAMGKLMELTVAEPGTSAQLVPMPCRHELVCACRIQ